MGNLKLLHQSSTTLFGPYFEKSLERNKLLCRYHQKALEYHPDKNPLCGSFFSDISEAYDVLSSSELAPTIYLF